MKFAYICPTACVNKFGVRGDFTLALSHLLDKDCTNEYAQAIKEISLPVYLDNGTYENGLPEDSESLLSKAEKLSAQYVFAPDYLYNAQKTLDGLIRFCKLRDQRGTNVKVAAVVQASSSKQYIDFYRYLSNLPCVQLIGLSILAIPYAFSSATGTKDIAQNRIEALRQISLRVSNPKRSHLLGLGDGLIDVYYAMLNCPWVESNDSSSAFQNGLEGKSFDRDTLLIKKSLGKLDFSIKALSQQQQDLITKNIDFITNLYVNRVTPASFRQKGRNRKNSRKSKTA